MDNTGTWVAKSRDELLAGATDRLVVNPADGKSGSEFELVTIEGERYFAKTLGYRTDWIMRVTGDRDLRHAADVAGRDHERRARRDRPRGRGDGGRR